MGCGGGAQPPDGRARTKTKSVVADGRQATCCGEAALWEALGRPCQSGDRLLDVLVYFDLLMENVKSFEHGTHRPC